MMKLKTMSHILDLYTITFSKIRPNCLVVGITEHSGKVSEMSHTDNQSENTACIQV